MKYYVVLLFATAIYADNQSRNNLKPYISDPIGPNTLKFIATVDGKSFFSDYTQGNWSRISEYCKSYGLQLASITSRDQYNALNGSYSTAFAGSYWTSGRDALSLRQFSWNVTDIELASEYLPFDKVAPIQTCVMFRSLPGISTVASYGCGGTNIYSLCETP